MPYGEWRWSPMGLAGRDPVFYSQLDSELAYLLKQPDKSQMVVNTCMNCHGAMGKKAFAVEHLTENVKVDFIYTTDPADKGFKYGSLGRDGVSCLVCHRMAAPENSSLSYFLKNKINGNFDLTPPDQLIGPFKDDVITTYPMDTGLGVKPNIPEPFLDATRPKGTAKDDPVYLAGKGQSIVRYEIPLPPGANASNVNATASLYLQTLPPYFLKDRYQTPTQATARLKHLATSLGTLSDTDFVNWKLLIASARR